MTILLLLSVAFLSYALAQKIIDKNIFSKIHRYLMEKDEKYYEELLKYYEKNKKVKLTTLEKKYYFKSHYADFARSFLLCSDVWLCKRNIRHSSAFFFGIFACHYFAICNSFSSSQLSRK